MTMTANGEVHPNSTAELNFTVNGFPDPVGAVPGVFSTFTISSQVIGYGNTAFVAGIGELKWSDFIYNAKYGGYMTSRAAVIDAEKTVYYKDNMMCWACAAANILAYTGWLTVGAATEDQLFDLFRDGFLYGDRYGGHTYYGLSWFFTGYDQPKDQNLPNFDHSKLGSGAFYSSVPDTTQYYQFVEWNAAKPTEMFQALDTSLKNGGGVELSLGWYSSGTRAGGHAITVWGYTCNNLLAPTDPNYYTGVIVSDSDDDKDKEDATKSPNVMKIIAMSYDAEVKKYQLSEDYSGTSQAYLEGIVTLKAADFVIISKDLARVRSAAVVADVTLDAKGPNLITVSNHGTANRTIVQAGTTLDVRSGGVINDTVVTGGTLMLFAKAVLGGKSRFFKDASITVSGLVSTRSGAEIVWELSGDGPGKGPIISNLDYIQGVARYSVNVSSTLAYGAYVLGGGATDFSASILFMGDGEELRQLENGKSLVFKNRLKVTLVKDTATLSVRISDGEKPTFAVTPQVKVDGYSATISCSAADNVGVVGYKFLIDGEHYDSTESEYTLDTMTLGDHTYSVSAVDAEGNWSEWTQTQRFAVVDDVAPFFSVPMVVRVLGDDVTFLFKASDNIAVTGYRLKVDDTIFETGDTTLALKHFTPGEHVCMIQAYDAAGNDSEWTSIQNFTVADIVAPVIGATPQAVIEDYDLVVTIGATDNLAVTEYQLEVADLGLFVADTGTVRVDGLSVGTYTYRCRAADAAGNFSDWTAWQRIAVSDVSAPAFDATPTATLDGYNLTLKFGATDNAAVARYVVNVGSREYITTQSTLVLTNMSVGNYDWQVRAFDTTGNVSVWQAETPLAINFTGLRADVKGYDVMLAWSVPVADCVQDRNYEISVGGVVVGVTTETSFKLKNFKPGTHDFSVALVDADGNRRGAGTSGTFTVVDVTAPRAGKITALSQQPGSYRLDLNWDNFTDNGTIAYYRLQVGDHWQQIAAGGERSATLRLNPGFIGKQTVSVTAVDAAGNVGKTITRKITIADVTSPTAVTDLNARTQKYSAALSWTVPYDNSGKISGYEIRISGNNGVLKSRRNGMTVKNLAVGVYTFTVTALDAAKNSSADGVSGRFEIVDVTAPSGGKITALAQKVGGYELNILWTGFKDNVAVDHYRIQIDNGAPRQFSAATTAATLQLDASIVGRRKISVTAVDAVGLAGKAVTKGFTFKDYTAPTTVTGLSAQVQSYTANLSWAAASDNSGKVSGYEVSIDGGKAFWSRGNTLRLKNLAVGSHEFTVTALDAAKNRAVTSSAYRFEVLDVTAPNKPSVKSVVKNNDVQLQWQTPKDNVGVLGYRLEIGDVSMALGADVLSWQAELPKGSYDYRLFALDAAGNSSLGATGKFTVKTALLA